jgi:hypothetical protein
MGNFRQQDRSSIKAQKKIVPVMGVSFLCVNLEVLKTIATTNTKIYHPNMTSIRLKIAQKSDDG